MNQSLENTLVLCDLDTLLLGADGNLTQVVRDVLQLYSGRGGRFTVFSQRSPRAVRTILGSVRLGAPALLCGGTLAYSFAEGSGRPLCGFEALSDEFLSGLPAAAGVGIALQMKDGTTRVLRMSQSLEQHLRQEWTPFLLSHAADVHSADVLRVLLYQDQKRSPVLQLFEKALAESAAPLRAERVAPDVLVLTPRGVTGKEMLDAVCGGAGLEPDALLVAAGSLPMLELVRAADRSAAGADAPAELRLAARRITLTDCAGGAAAEILYGLVRNAEKNAAPAKNR